MAPSKTTKKAAKKHLAPDDKKPRHRDKKHDDKKHKESKDLRRAYEHLGRLSALGKTLTARTVAQIKTLTDLAQRSLLAEDPRSAADLLRAAEHLAFGSLAQTARATRLSDVLESALNLELDHLTEKASEHWKKHESERPAEISDIYEFMRAIAETSRVKGAYRRALEFARGAEALAHVRASEAHAHALLDGNSALKLSPEDD